MDSVIISWIVASVIAALNIAATTTIGILINKWFKQREEKEKKAAENEAKLKKLEKEEEARALHEAMKSQCELQICAFRKEMEPFGAKLDKIENGTLSGLRNDILFAFYQCRDNQHFRTEWDTQNIEDLYKSYNDLNGNSFVSHLMEEFYKIPLK